MTQSQTQSIQFLETQPGFHRNKVRGYKEAVESICHLPLDKDFTAKILEDFRQFQGFDIIQFSKITCLIKKFCVTSNFQCEVEKFLEMCQRQEMGMDISVFLKIVLDILSSKETTENTVTSLDSTMKELDKLHNELAGSGAFNIRETEQTLYFVYSSEYYHPSSRFLECYDTLKWRLHQESGRLLINSTVSLIRVEKARKVLGYPPGWVQGPVLKAWLKLLRTPYIGNNLAILIAETERDHCNKAVEVFGKKPSNAGDQYLQNNFPILPGIAAAIDKLNSHSNDDVQAGNVVVQMMRESGSFDTDLSKWTETTIPQAQMEERWKMLFMAAGLWKAFPVVLTQLLLKTSLSNNDFKVLLRCSASFILNALPTGPESFVYLCKWIIARKALCTSTMVKLLRAVSDDKESILVLAGLVVFLRRIDGLIEGGGEQAEKRKSNFITIFLDLRFQLLTQRHGFPDLLKVPDNLVKCYCTGTLSAEELKLMVRNFLSVAESGVATAETLWQVLVSICCNARIVNKAGLWNKCLNILPSFQRRKDGFRLQLAIGGALGVLAEENALSLLDQVLPDLDFLSRQVTFFNRFVHGDVNGHFSLMSSIIQRTAAADKDHLVESLTRINMIISSLPVSAVIPGSVYDTLVVAVAGSVAVGTRKVMLDYHVCRCVAGALCTLSEPMEVLSMYLKVKFLLVRARESSASSNGQLIQGQQMMAPVQVLASDIWMDTFVNGAAILLSTSGSVSQKMSYLSTFHDAVCRDGIREPQELCKAIADCMTPFKQNECDEYRNLLFKCMEEMLHVDNILKVLGRAHTEEVHGQWELLCFPRALPTPLTCLILEKFPGNVKCKEALKVYRFLALLVDKDYLHALLRVFPAALKNQTAAKDVLDELQILTNILMSAPPAVLPLVTDWLVASYFYNVSGTQRESFVKEIMKVQGISANMHNLLQTSRLFAKGWQKTGDVQGILNKLLEMLRHVDEDLLSRYLSAPIDLVHRVDHLPGREGELFCEELHWLLLETDLSATDAALCIKLTLPSFYRDILPLQGPEYVPEVEGNHEENAFRSPIRVAHAFLLTLRCNLSIGKNQERLLEKLLRAVFERGLFPPCRDVMTEDATSGNIFSPGRPRTMRESITDLLKLITFSKSESELVFWLETPCLLTCGHTMNVVLETCKWRGDGQDTNDESRMDINCKVRCFLIMEMMTGMYGPCVGFPIDYLPKLLQLNLNHKLSAKLLDLHLLNEELALACGSIVSKWQSSEEGSALFKKLISLWKEKTKSCSDLPGEFEIACVSSIVRCQPVPESAERVVRLYNQLHARRMLGEHHPLHKATCWSKEVSPLKISPEVTAAWLTIFYAANVKWHDVSVITALTPRAMDLLTPGSTCIKDCLFTSHTVNKILISNQEGVNEKELKFALTLARLLNDFLVLAQRLENSGSPNSAAVVAILQDASYKLCKSFRESAVHRYSQNGREKREKIPHLAASQGRQSTDDTQLVAHPDGGTDNSTATSASSRYKHPDSTHLAEVPKTYMVQGTFSNCLSTGDGATASSVNREVPVAEDPTLKDDVGQWSTQVGQHQNSLRAAMRKLHKIRQDYLKTVLIEMYGSNESNPTHPESMLMGRKNSLESVLLLLRRWLATTASKDTKAPVLKGHMDRIFSIIVRGNHLPTVQRSSHSSEAVEVSSSPRLVVAVDTNCKEGTETDSDTFLCSEDAITKTERRVSSPGYPPPLAGSTDVVAVVNPRTQTAASTPVPSAVATTVAANYEITTTVSQLQPSGTVGSSSVVDLSAPNHNQAEYSSVPESSTMKRTSPKQAASNFREDEHAQHGDDCVLENSLPQVVQDYVFNLSDNQTCIARLQRSGYNQCEASDDDKSPRNLWYDPCIKLSSLVSKQQDVRDLEETGRLRNICNEYLDLLMFAKVESVDVNGESLPVRNLFAYELSLKELNQQIAVVRQRLQKLQDLALQDWYQRVSQREEEFRRSITVLRELSSQETQESDQQKEARTFSILWENQFFEAIKLCSENIPGCYAPNGFHSHKPIQCALCVDSRIISVFEEKSGKSPKEVENVEVKLLEAGMFVYDLHSGQLEMATDELWAAFYKFLLEKRLVPKIILSKNSPAFGWAKRLVGSEGEEELDAREMKFHETVIPMQESYYDSYPSFGEKNGKDVHTAALTLTAENVKHFVFSDLQLLDPSDTDTKGGVRNLTREVMSDLRDKLLEKFQKADGQLLLGCLGHSVPKVCGQVIRDNLSTREIERNLKLGIDVTKLWKDIKEAHKVEVEWFVETIVNLIIEKRPNQDI